MHADVRERSRGREVSGEGTLKEVAFALGRKDPRGSFKCRPMVKGWEAESHQAGSERSGSQTGCSSEVDGSRATGLGGEGWAMLWRDSKSKQGGWNLMAKVPLKELGRGATV